MSSENEKTARVLMIYPRKCEAEAALKQRRYTQDGDVWRTEGGSLKKVARHPTITNHWCIVEGRK